jgi:ATPase subunit of ABC transporter with duplicated ATPase domains
MAFVHYADWIIRFPETDKISPPLLQMNEVTFGYTTDRLILKNVNFDVGLDSRVAMVGANGAGKSTLYVFPSLCHTSAHSLRTSASKFSLVN